MRHHHIGDRDQGGGQRRHLGIELLEQPRHVGHHVVDPEAGHGEDGGEHEDRVDQRGADVAPDVDHALDVFGRLGQHLVQRARLVADVDQVAHRLGKQVGVAGKGLRPW
jgi:hypothetical protein